MKKNQITAIFFILVILFSVSTKQAHAKWKSKKDELPGYNDGSSTTALVVAGGVAVGVLVYFLVKKNKQKKVAINMAKYRESKQVLLWENNINTNDDIIATSSETNNCIEKGTNALVTCKNGCFLQQVEDASNAMPVNLLITPLNTKDQFAMKNINGIQVGLRFKF